MGLPRYLALAAPDDLEQTLLLADSLTEDVERANTVALVECGRPSAAASQVAIILRAAGRQPVSVLLTHRADAQSALTVNKLSGATAVWVFADNLYEAFTNVFATQFAFALRAAARNGLPVVGIGGGAVALGGLMLASRVCHNAPYDLVTGLGWAPRVLVDGGADRDQIDAALLRRAVHGLPGLMGVDVGVRGGLKARGGRVESVGDEPVVLLGTDDAGRLVSLPLDPGQATSIAPPPLVPFSSALLTAETAEALRTEHLPLLAKAPEPLRAPPPSDKAHAASEASRICPVCNRTHAQK